MRIVIPEPISSLNKGELAILGGLREALNICGEYELSVYSPPQWYDDDKRNSENKYNVISGVDLFDMGNQFLDRPEPRTRMHFFKTWGKLLAFSISYRFARRLATVLLEDPLLESISNSDLILAGHDGVLGYNHFYLVLAAKIMGKPIALYGGGNDLKGKASYKVQKYFQFAINNSLLCTVRDPGTRNYLVQNGVLPEKVHLFPDPAVLLKPCDDSDVFRILQKEGIPFGNEKPLFGLIPVRGGIVFHKSFTFERDLQKKHGLRIKLWVDILEHLLKNTNAHFVFIPHCIGPVYQNDDRRMSRDIYDAVSNKDRFTYIENEYNPSELKGILKHCAFVLGERTHALIGSVSVGTPCLALTTEEDLRMHYIMENMFGRKTYDLNNPNTEDVIRLLMSEWNNRPQIAEEMKEKAMQVHNEAYRSACLLKEAIESSIKASE